MIVGTGIDIAEVPRIALALSRHGDRFLQRIYTPGEIRYCDSKANRVERYAARFAAKEAGMKALGTGWNHGVRWRDIEVSRQPGSRPTITFHGKAAEFAARLGAVHIALSLSHTADQAMLCGMALSSFSALLLELALTRLFSVVLFYHFAFLAISIALLGLGAGGVFAYLLKRRLKRVPTRTLASRLC